MSWPKRWIDPGVGTRADGHLTVAEMQQSRIQDVLKAHASLTADVEFHLALARMTHNPFLDRLLHVTNEWMAPTRQNTLQSSRRIEASLAAHKNICAAVAASMPTPSSRTSSCTYAPAFGSPPAAERANAS